MDLLRASFVAQLFLFGLNATAQSIPLQNLTDSDLSKIVGDLSVNFLHTSVSGASTLGHLYGFEVGVVAGKTNTPHLNEVANQVPGNNADAGKLYDAELLGILTVPLGLTVELGLVPKVGSSSFKFSAFSGAVKWTPTEVLLDLPVSLAGKLSFTTDSLTFNSTANGTPIDYSYSNSEIAFTALVSKNFAIVEPYFGLGYVSAKGRLSADSSIFNSGFTTDTSASASRSGALWMIGAEVKLVVVKLGLEYMSLFNTDRVMGKVSVYF